LIPSTRPESVLGKGDVKAGSFSRAHPWKESIVQENAWKKNRKHVLEMMCTFKRRLLKGAFVGVEFHLLVVSRKNLEYKERIAKRSSGH